MSNASSYTQSIVNVTFDIFKYFSSKKYSYSNAKAKMKRIYFGNSPFREGIRLPKYNPIYCLILVSSMILSIPIKAQITEIPDPIFEEFLISRGFDSDGVINGQILTSDAASISSLIINDAQPFFFINDFTGIQDFTALSTFVTNFSNATELDLSNLKNLSFLSGINNDNLAFLDISQAINLATFSMGAAGGNLTTLILPETDSIETFSLSGSGLIDLDLSAYPNLEQVSLSNNLSLETLNIANGNNLNIDSFGALGNPNLRCIIVDDAAYSEANWPNIPDGATYVETEAACEALSIADDSLLTFNIYPNPATDFFNIQTTTTPIQQLDILDLSGKRIKSFSQSENTYAIDNMPAGLYLLSIQTTVGSSIHKLVVQ